MWRSKHLRRLERALADPIGTQAKLLRGLVRTAKDTEFGKAHGFAQIAAADDVIAAYQKAVPLHTDGDFAEPIERMRRGEPDVLWPGRVRMFAKTAGTTGRDKIVPATMRRLREGHWLGRTMVAWHERRIGRRLLTGKIVTNGARRYPDPEHRGNLYGDMSGLIAAERRRAVGPVGRILFDLLYMPLSIAEMSDVNARIGAIADYAIGRRVGALGGLPSWLLLLIDRAIERHNQQASRPVTTAAEIWPKLNCVITGGSPLAPYREPLRRRIGSEDCVMFESYMASEGGYAFQDDLDDPGLLVYPCGSVCFEFVPLEDYGSPDAPRFTLADVEEGVQYVMHVTTSAGLWAMSVGDVVEFIGRWPHRLLIKGRVAEVIRNIGPRNIRGPEVRESIRVAGEQSGLRPLAFHVTVEADDRGVGFLGLVEFDAVEPDVTSYAVAADAALRQRNEHYEAGRCAGNVKPWRVISLPVGTFHRWQLANVPHLTAETKVPAMSEQREFADAVLKMAGVHPASPSTAGSTNA